MQEKKAVYVIPAVDMSKVSIPIPQKDQEAYEIDYQKKEKILGEKQAEFFALPKGEGLKPVFYVQLGKRLYFGFTPRPRLFYAHTVKENMAKKHPGTTLDFASSMFGFSRTENMNGKSVSKSYKSKLSFSDAVIISKDNPVDPRCTNIPIVLSEPKSSSIADYLVQDGANVTTSYNDDGFELRGVKQYWLHKNADTKPQVDIEKQKKMLSYLNPLKPGTKFEGKVRFHNLTELELGLLLWSLKLEKDSWMNIGKAKSFGYGAIKVTLGKVRILNWEKAYSLDALSMDPWNEGVDVDKYIESFKSYLYSDAAGVYKEPPHIKDFFAMKDSTRIPNPADIRFMNIDAGEYRNRKALPTVQETIKNKK
jgi:CRISPR-associated protein (TIGR03986 family)